MHCYVQSTGCWYDRDGQLRGRGYAGSPKGKNNPLMQAVHSTGPIPQGQWSIEGPPFDTATHGPHVLRLNPAPGTQTFGRAGFLIHGDNMGDPGNGSEGCIVLDRTVRDWIWSSGDLDLLVVADDSGRPAACG